MTGDDSVYRHAGRVLSRRDRLNRDMIDSLQDGVPDEQTSLWTATLDLPLALDGSRAAPLRVYAREDFTADGAAGETITLSHNPVDSPETARDLWIERNGDLVDPVDVRYSRDEIDVDTTQGDSVSVYYCSGSPARVDLTAESPSGSVDKTPFSTLLNLVHRRAEREDGGEPARMDSMDSRWFPLVPRDWTISLRATAPYRATLQRDGGSLDPARLGLPIVRGSRPVDGLDSAVRSDIARSGRI